jgi:hypothetical protein
MLWFGTLLPIHLRVYGIRVNDDPFNTMSRTFAINGDHAFIPFDTMGTVVHSGSRVPTAEWKKTTGTAVHLKIHVPTEWWKKTAGTVVHLESHVPTEWEKTHLPIRLLSTSEDWNPSPEVLRG